jgi:hypothetical protein
MQFKIMVMIFCAPDFSNAPKIIPKNRKDYFYHNNESRKNGMI